MVSAQRSPLCRILFLLLLSCSYPPAYRNKNCHGVVNAKPDDHFLSEPIYEDYSVDAAAGGVEEEHDATWEERVRHLRRFLTRESRERLRNEMQIRMLEKKEEQNQQQQRKRKQQQQKRERSLSNSVRGYQQEQAKSDESGEQEQRDLLVASGTDFNVLVVLLQWTNHPTRDQAVSQEDYDALFNGEGRDPVLYPGGSVKGYFNAASFGEFTINFEVTPWIMTEYSEQDVTADGSRGRSTQIQMALNSALQKLDEDLFDFDKFDSDFDGKLDLTVFMHSGYDGVNAGADCETGIMADQRVASSARTASNGGFISNTGKQLGAHIVAPAFRLRCGTEIMQIGTIVHELIHPFGVMEMYDPETLVGGIGQFCVMGDTRGANGAKPAARPDLAWPGYPAAYTRSLLGWGEQEVIEADGTYELEPVGVSSKVYKITKGYADREYLLLENRQPISGDLDENFFSPGGINIYHIDEANWDTYRTSPQGNFPAGGPYLADWPGNGKHYPVALLQADGEYHLEQGTNKGESADLWNDPSQVLGPGNGETVASAAVYPNTDSYQNGNISPTGLTLSNFRMKPGRSGTNTMMFDVCGISGTDCSQNPEDPVGQDEDTAATEQPEAATVFPEDSPTNSPSLATSTSPSLADSNSPSRDPSEMPSVSPSASPSQIPSSTPPTTPTNFPSSQPTLFERLENGNCEIAAETFSSDAPKGLGNITDGEVHQTCNGEEREGVWYKIDAGSVPAGEVIQASTCFPQTNTINSISVFRGTNCTSLECVETDSMSCRNGEVGNVVFWSAASEEDYYLFAHTVGSTDQTPDLQKFSDGALLLNLASFPLTENDECSGAVKLPIDGSVAISGVTEGARPDTSYNASCGVESAGVWYKVTGTGSSLQATTCLAGTDHPTQIHVFSGGSCEDLVCVSVEANNSAVCSDTSIAGNSATVNWETNEGDEYFILVGSADGSVGKFELKVTEFSPALNDQCSDAIPVTIGSEVSGFTQAATNDFPHGEYCGLPLNTAGVWYEMEGTGSAVSFSTCLGDDYSSAISVFTGSDCDELQCLTGVATRDPTCDYNGVTATWLSQTNETYFIYVHGNAPDSYGSFNASIEEPFVTESNSFCDEALPIREDDNIFQGSTENATYTAPTDTCGVDIVNPGLWYTFNGTGYSFEIDLCTDDEAVDFAISFSLFSGETCGNLQCISGSTFIEKICGEDEIGNTTRFLQDSNSSLESASTIVESEQGVVYHLLVHGQGPSAFNGFNTGDFELTVQSLAPPTPAPSTPSSAPSTSFPSSAPSIRAARKNAKKKRSRKLYYLFFLLLIPILICCIIACCYWKGAEARREGEEGRGEDGDYEIAKPTTEYDEEQVLFDDEDDSSSDDESSSNTDDETYSRHDSPDPSPKSEDDSSRSEDDSSGSEDDSSSSEDSSGSESSPEPPPVRESPPVRALPPQSESAAATPPPPPLPPQQTQQKQKQKQTQTQTQQTQTQKQKQQTQQQQQQQHYLPSNTNNTNTSTTPSTNTNTST